MVFLLKLSLKSSNGCFGLLIHKGTECEVGRAQKNIFVFFRTPYCSTSFDYAVLVQSCLLNKSVKRVIGYNVEQKAKNHVLNHGVTS